MRGRVDTMKEVAERRRQGMDAARKELDGMKSEIERLTKELNAIKALLKELAGPAEGEN